MTNKARGFGPAFSWPEAYDHRLRHDIPRGNPH
jgi:hypothetical protein